MSALPDHVSGVSRIDGAPLDGSPGRRREVNGVWGVEEGGFFIPDEPSETYVLPVLPPPPVLEYVWTRPKRPRRPRRPALAVVPDPPRARRKRAVLVARADPMVWARVLELGWDPERISIDTDGSVTLHNHAWQAKAARRKELE